MADHRFEPTDNPNAIHEYDQDCYICNPSLLKDTEDETVIDGEAVPIDALLDNAIGELPRANDPSLEQALCNEEGGDPDELTEPEQVGINTESTVLPELLSPTVEYGGPRIDTPREVSYGDLPDNDTGPEPTLPEQSVNPLFDALNMEETVMESDEGMTNPDTEPAHAPHFGLTEMAALSAEEIRVIAIERLKEIETALVQKQLRKFEIEALEGQEADEYGETMDAIETFLTLQISYVTAFQQLEG